MPHTVLSPCGRHGFAVISAVASHQKRFLVRFSAFSAWSVHVPPCTAQGYLPGLQLPPTGRLIRVFKLAIGVNMGVNGFLYIYLLRDWLLQPLPTTLTWTDGWKNRYSLPLFILILATRWQHNATQQSPVTWLVSELPSMCVSECV